MFRCPVFMSTNQTLSEIDSSFNVCIRFVIYNVLILTLSVFKSKSLLSHLAACCEPQSQDSVQKLQQLNEEWSRLDSLLTRFHLQVEVRFFFCFTSFSFLLCLTSDLKVKLKHIN